MKQLFLIVLILAVISCSEKDKTPMEGSRTIMAILAHPDDESAVGQVLAKYADQGNTVILVIAADGRYGVEEHFGIPAGDTLVQIRQKESMCAAEILGIEPPIFLGFHDGFGLLSGLGEYFTQTAEMKERLKLIIQEKDPDAIITFGPDGDTGHLDHKGIGDLTTEVILREGWYEKYPLYYIGWLKEKEVWIPQGATTSLNYVDKSYLNVHIKYSEEDRDKLFKSLYCYESQFQKTDVENWIEAELKDSSFTFYFRRLVTEQHIQDHF